MQNILKIKKTENAIDFIEKEKQPFYYKYFAHFELEPFDKKERYKLAKIRDIHRLSKPISREYL